jgi:hypothetical protein
MSTLSHWSEDMGTRLDKPSLDRAGTGIDVLTGDDVTGEVTVAAGDVVLRAGGPAGGEEE